MYYRSRKKENSKIITERDDSQTQKMETREERDDDVPEDIVRVGAVKIENKFKNNKIEKKQRVSSSY